MSGTPHRRPARLGSLGVRTELGLFAFAPVLTLMAVQARDRSWMWLPFAVLAAGGVVVAVVSATAVTRGAPEPFDFGDIDDAGDDVIGHVATFLIPVLVSTNQSAGQIAIAGIALGFVVLLHVATGRVHVNPILYVLGYRCYRAAATAPDASGATSSTGYYLIARSDPALWNTTRQCIQVGSSVLIERTHP